MKVQTLSLQAIWGTFLTKIIRRKVLHNIGMLTVTNVIRMALSLMQGILIARWMGPELYGVAALVISYPGLVYTFFEARSSEASVKYVSEFHARNERDRVLAMCKLSYAVDFTLAVLAFLVVLVTAPWAAKSIAHRPETAGLIILYVVALIPHSLAGTSQALLTVLGRFHVITVIETATTVVRVTLVLALVFVGWGVSGVVWGHAIAMTFTGLFYGGIAFALIQRTWDLSVLQGSWQALQGRRREIMRFLIYSDCNALLGMFMKQMDVLLLGYLCNPTEAGYYKLAKSFASTISNLTNPLQTVIYPKLSYLWGAGRVDDFHQMIYKLALGLGLPLAIMVLFGLLSVPLLILSFLGESYLPMSLAAQLLLTVTGLRLIGFWIKPFYLSTGQMRLWTTFSLIGAVLSIPGYAGSIWLWGSQGLATARLGLGIVTDVIPGIKAMFWVFKNQSTTSTKG